MGISLISVVNRLYRNFWGVMSRGYGGSGSEILRFGLYEISSFLSISIDISVRCKCGKSDRSSFRCEVRCISIVCSTRFLNDRLLVVISNLAVLSIVVEMKVSRVSSAFVLDGQYVLKMLIVDLLCCNMQEAIIFLSSVWLLFLLIVMFIEIDFFLKLEDMSDSHFSIGGFWNAERGLGNDSSSKVAWIGGVECRRLYIISLIFAYM